MLEDQDSMNNLEIEFFHLDNEPHVEFYKKNLKPQSDGKDVVVAGRIS